MMCPEEGKPYVFQSLIPDQTGTLKVGKRMVGREGRAAEDFSFQETSMLIFSVEKTVMERFTPHLPFDMHHNACF